MIAKLKMLFVLLCLILVLAFIFSDGLLYYCSRWHEKTGETKEAMSGYRELIKKHPGSRWVEKAKSAVKRLRGENE